MGRNLKSSVRESSRLDLVLGVHQNIVYLAALFADKVLVALDQRSIGLLPQLTKHFHIIDSPYSDRLLPQMILLPALDKVRYMVPA